MNSNTSKKLTKAWFGIPSETVCCKLRLHWEEWVLHLWLKRFLASTDANLTATFEIIGLSVDLLTFLIEIGQQPGVIFGKSRLTEIQRKMKKPNSLQSRLLSKKLMFLNEILMDDDKPRFNGTNVVHCQGTWQLTALLNRLESQDPNGEKFDIFQNYVFRKTTSTSRTSWKGSGHLSYHKRIL